MGPVHRRRRAAGAHLETPRRDAGKWVPADDLNRRRLGRAVLPHTPGATVGLHVDRLVTLRQVEEGDAGDLVGSPHPPPPPVVTFLKHVVEGGVQHPEVSFPPPGALRHGHLEEALVEREIVPNAVLPAPFAVFVIYKFRLDVVVYSSQGQSLVVAVLYGHCDESHVRVWRPLLFPLVTVGLSRRGPGADIQHWLWVEVHLLLGHDSQCLSASSALLGEV